MPVAKQQKKSIMRQIQELGYNVGDIKPCRDRVLVRRFPEEETKGLIYIPESVREKSFWGEVLEVGPGKVIDGVWHSLEVKRGDIVNFGKWNDFEAITPNEELLLLQEADIRVVRLPRVQ